MSKSALVCLTGIPGTGKSTAAARLLRECQKRDITITFIGDYPFLQAWAVANRGQEDKVLWITDEAGHEIFLIQPQAYREVSRTVALLIADEVRQQVAQHEVIVIESARGAGPDGQRDRYDQELFQPLRETLGDLVEFVNLELVVDDHRELMERVTRRFAEDPQAAPPFVTEKYISSVEGIQSATQQASELGMFAINQEVNNTGDRETMTEVLGIVAAQILDLLAEPVREEESTEISHDRRYFM